MTKAPPAEGLPMETLERAGAVLRVLGHAHRLKIVEFLTADGPANVSDLTGRLGLAQNAVSQHLNFMKAHGILASYRDGRNVFYEVVHPSAKMVIQCIRKHMSED